MTKHFRHIGLLITAFITVVLILQIGSVKLTALFVVGLGLGAVLNYFIFGFSSAWRRCIVQQRTQGIRAQIVMLALAILLFTPLLWLGQIGNQDLQGLVRPIGLSVVIGAFLFGIGMQIAGNCSSGTLNRLGQLQPLSFVSFLMLFVGGVVGAFLFDTWSNWPSFIPYSLTLDFGLPGLVVSLLALGAIYLWMHRCEKSHCPRVEPLWRSALLTAGILLALLNLAVLLLSGQPWSIASVFTLWSLKLSDTLNLGLDWPFWSVAGLYQARMMQPLLADAVSLTTIGLILGSLWVTLLQSKKPICDGFNPKTFSFYVVGGFLMGFGATLSYGCNIGAFFSGIASGSLHGWLWILFAVFGNIVGLKLVNSKPRI
jgi:hypothetical protein